MRTLPPSPSFTPSTPPAQPGAGRHWLAVACAGHVRLGRAQGFMQVCHGRCSPLRRLRPGDRVAYYSPGEAFTGPKRLRSFTAAGLVLEGDPYAFDMGDGFVPYRRDVRWLGTREAPIAPLLGTLDFTAGRPHWGASLRPGLLELSGHDMDLIFEATGSGWPT